MRTQLTSALGTLDLVLATKLTPEQQRYLELSRKAGDSLLTLLDDTLEMSLLETRRTEIEHIQFWLKDCLSKVSSDAGKHAVIEVAKGVPELVIGDPYRLRQAFQKIIEHFRKSYPNGAILIEVSVDSGVGQSFEAEGRWQSVLFTVRRGGSGTARSAARTLSAPAKQVPGTAVRKYGGIAIGLDVCGHMIKLMGGRMWLDSVGAEDDRFYFTAQFDCRSNRRKGIR